MSSSPSQGPDHGTPRDGTPRAGTPRAGTPRDSWGFEQGDAITAELAALRPLGGGSAYEAFLAFDEITYGPVVVKVVRPNLVGDGSTMRGLSREIDALEHVRHPVVVRALRWEEQGARPHLVLEHVEGPRLSSLIRKYGALQPEQYLPLAIDLASALSYFRRVDAVHLDIKPSNVIMGAPAKLIDLSVMRPLAQAEALTSAIGTDAYMAPEQTVPPHTGTPCFASDIWGLGATLFHAIAGQRPFPDGDPDATQPGERFPQLLEAPGSLPPRTAPEVVKVVEAMLEDDPAARPLPEEVAEALRPALERLPRRHRLAGALRAR